MLLLTHVAELAKVARRAQSRHMDQRITEELLEELLEADTPQEFIDKNDIKDATLSEYLQELLEAKGLRRIDVIRAASLNETFGYQIFTGARGAGRDTALQLAFAMHLNLRETNRLLQASGANNLYCKDRRDAIIIFCVDHDCSLQKANEELYRFGEKTIC